MRIYTSAQNTEFTGRSSSILDDLSRKDFVHAYALIHFPKDRPMCGRFVLFHDAATLAEYLPVERVAFSPQQRYNIAPTQAVAAVLCLPEESGRTLNVLQWGLVPFWAKDVRMGSRMINTQAETAAQKPAYRTAFKRRRCLLPASGYYEWKKQPHGKTPHYISMADGRPFGMAGLWEEWNSPDSELLHTCSVLTTEASTEVAAIHRRMPVILGADAQLCWLEADPENRIQLQSLFKAYLRDDPSCIEPMLN